MAEETATIPETVNKSKRDAILLALLVGAPSWLYTYDQNKVKLWLGVAFQAAVLLIAYVVVTLILVEISEDSNHDGVASLTEIVNFVKSTDWAKYTLLAAAALTALTHAVVLLDRLAKPARWYAKQSRKPVNKIAAILLAVFTYHFTWLYTYDRNKTKFWIGYLVFAFYFTVIFSILTLPNTGETPEASIIAPVILGVLLGTAMMWGLWIWAIVDTASKSDDWYKDYPYRRR